MAVADIFTALAENRPYRRGMNTDKIAIILQDQAVRNFQDPRIVKLLLDNIGEISRSVIQKQAEVRDYYEMKMVPKNAPSSPGVFSDSPRVP